MKYDLKKPCQNCPFLKGTPMRLLPERAKEVLDNMLSYNGGYFACHKTTESDEEGDAQATTNSSHCAGALIFAEKQGNATQMMRIDERLGFYDHRVLMTDKNTVALVFDDYDEAFEQLTRP